MNSGQINERLSNKLACYYGYGPSKTQKKQQQNNN